VGNRTSQTQSSTTKTHTYASTSNRQTGFDGEAIGYDESGNRISDIDGARTYVYNAAGRLVEVKTGASTLATYAYNALGQRVQKDDQVQETEFVYDLEGNLIGEYDDGTPIREYVYLNGVPVLRIEGATKFYLHPDHLGTPRSATDSAKDIVWTWGGEAFGSNLPDEDPDNDATDTTVNLRFPGQYFDAETGHHYNYFRDYEPLMGRYVQSDPSGLNGGMNTYAYAQQDPVGAFDPRGLWVWVLAPAAPAVGEAVATALGIVGLGILANQVGSDSRHDRSVADVVDDLNARGAEDGVTFPWPDKTPRQWTCICRAQDLSSSCGPAVGYGWGTANDKRTARKIAESMARMNAGGSDFHHTQCKCTGPKGERGG
jgi:RHS repeat-associated protein